MQRVHIKKRLTTGLRLQERARIALPSGCRPLLVGCSLFHASVVSLKLMGLGRECFAHPDGEPDVRSKPSFQNSVLRYFPAPASNRIIRRCEIIRRIATLDNLDNTEMAG